LSCLVTVKAVTCVVASESMPWWSQCGGVPLLVHAGAGKCSASLVPTQATWPGARTTWGMAVQAGQDLAAGRTTTGLLGAARWAHLRPVR
jgi:hypothetical protein